MADYLTDLSRLGTGTFNIPMPSEPVATPQIATPVPTYDTAGLDSLIASKSALYPSAPQTGGGFNFGDWARQSGMLGSTNAEGIRTDGWGGLALGAASGVMNGFMGLQQLNLAKQTLRENKRQFQLNFDAQRKTVNSAMEDRQRARVASSPGAYQSVGDYMNKHGI